MQNRTFEQIIDLSASVIKPHSTTRHNFIKIWSFTLNNFK